MVWKISAVVLFGPLMSTLDSTVVNVSLSTLGRELHAPLTQIQWVTTGYLLALALMLPLSGWLVDRLGAKRVYLACFTLFTLTSLLCGAARSADQLVAFRVLQGMAGGLLAPMAQMMTARVAGRHVARVMGFMVMPILMGPLLGLILAGFILQHTIWRWIFLINIPIGLVAIGLALWILPRDANETQPRAFDLRGFLLLPPGLVLFLHALESLSANPAAHRLSLAELAAACALLTAFALHARRLGPTALIDLNLFRARTFSAAASTQFLSNAMSFGGGMLLPLYLIEVLHRSPGSTGLLLVPSALGMFCSYPLMGTLTERFGSRRVSATGAAISLLGTLPFALFGAPGLPLPALCAALFVRGIGMGAINIPSIAAAYAGIPRSLIPVATTSINIAQRLGGPIATTLLAIFLHHRLTTHTNAAPKAFVATFWILCFIHLAGAASALRLPLRAQHSRPAETSADPS
jgi:EmrB/QacA subfamily drug resistance transporter